MSDISVQNKAAGDDELDLIQLLRLIWRGKWIILFFAAACLAMAVFYVREVATPRYAATARMVIDSANKPNVDLGGYFSGWTNDFLSMNTEIEIITARSLIEQVVRDLELHKRPEFNGYLREPSPYSREAITARINELISGPPPPRPPQSEAAAIAAATGAVQRSIQVFIPEATFIFDITATSTNRALAVAIANRVSELYIEQQIETQFEAVEWSVNWLSERVTELEGELTAQQTEIERVRSTAEVVSAEGLEALTLVAREMRDRIEQIDLNLSQAVARQEEVQGLRTEDDAAGLLSFFNDPTLRRIGINADGSVPPMFMDRVDTLSARIDADVERLQVQRAALEQSLEQTRAEIEAEAETVGQLELLLREAEATRTLLNTFTSRLKETSLQIGLQQAESRILSPAIGAGKVAPRTNRIYSLSIVIGMLVGILIVVMRQFAQTGFRTSSEVENATGVSVLGKIPIMPVKRREALVGYLRDKPTSAAAEAIRNLRTSVTLSNPDNPPSVIMVTSSLPGEGKTTISVSMAMNLAGLGRKVLLIEGDIRRQTINRYFQADKSKGVVSVIMGETALTDTVIRQEKPRFDVLMGQKAAVNAADLWASERFRRFIEEARAEYDHIVIDTPPVLVVPDARVIARYVDAVLYVVKWHATDKEQVGEGVQQLKSIGVSIAGIVLSQIDLKRMNKYGYGGRYGNYARYGMGYYDN